MISAFSHIIFSCHRILNSFVTTARRIIVLRCALPTPQATPQCRRALLKTGPPGLRRALKTTDGMD